MAKRVFEIAKELGVSSKSIVQRARDEGMPPSVIKNHMSTVKDDLEVKIRQWASEGALNKIPSKRKAIYGQEVRKKRLAPKHAHTVTSIEILVDPGEASAEELAELLIAISDLYRKLGGSGIVFTRSDIQAGVTA